MICLLPSAENVSVHIILYEICPLLDSYGERHEVFVMNLMKAELKSTKRAKHCGSNLQYIYISFEGGRRMVESREA